MLLDQYLNSAIHIAKEAGNYLKSRFDTPHEINHKSHINDLVTECDMHSEKLIKSYLKHAYPESSFLCEESGSDLHQGDLLWVIDPLDGTVNFAKKIPFYCVSIALLIKGELSIGVIYSPMTNELFYSKKHGGAFLNDQPIHVTKQADLKKGFGATGFPYLVQNNVEASLHPIRELLKKGVPLRRLGSAALDIAYTACGRFDLFFEAHLEAWDYAAGALLLKEAGGNITDFQNKQLFFKTSSSVLATNMHLHSQMLNVVI